MTFEQQTPLCDLRGVEDDPYDLGVPGASAAHLLVHGVGRVALLAGSGRDHAGGLQELALDV
jgi:hypothetical protein